MNDKFAAWAAALALFSATLVPCAYAENVQSTPGVVDVSAKACLLMERETGTVLYADNEHEQLEPA